MRVSPGGTGRLAGVSVVVTRPRGDVDDLSAALRAQGARVVHFPVLEIADPDDGGAALRRAVTSLSRFDWVALTSANAARRFLDLVPDASALRGVRLAVVGSATAATLAARHLVADLVPERASAEGLGEAFPLAAEPGAAVLFPASASARPTLPHMLRVKGWAVQQVVAYRTLPAPAPPQRRVRELKKALAVTFASPSAVRAYVSLSADDGQPLPVPPVVACIGGVTAAAARDAGLRVAAVASVASGASLVDALVDALAGGAPVKGASVKGASVKGAPVKGAPVKGASVKGPSGEAGLPPR